MQQENSSSSQQRLYINPLQNPLKPLPFPPFFSLKRATYPKLCTLLQASKGPTVLGFFQELGEFQREKDNFLKYFWIPFKLFFM